MNSASATLVPEILALWRSVSARAFHGPGCGCCGAQPVLIDPDVLREDIAYTLRRRYRGEGRDDLVSILEAAEQAGPGFAAWITAVGSGSDAASARFILQDVDLTLRSLPDANGSSR